MFSCNGLCASGRKILIFLLLVNSTIEKYYDIEYDYTMMLRVFFFLLFEKIVLLGCDGVVFIFQVATLERNSHFLLCHDTTEMRFASS